jgi:hypothetical protein
VQVEEIQKHLLVARKELALVMGVKRAQTALLHVNEAMGLLGEVVAEDESPNLNFEPPGGTR